MPEKMSLEIGTESAGNNSLEKLKAESKAAAQEAKLLMEKRPRIELCLDECVEWIKKQEFESYVEKELIKAASRCPHSALMHFMQTIQQEITRIIRRRKIKHDKKENPKVSKSLEENTRKKTSTFSSKEVPSDFGAASDG